MKWIKKGRYEMNKEGKVWNEERREGMKWIKKGGYEMNKEGQVWNE